MLVLVLVLLAAVIVPRIATKLISGHPTATPVPGPPAVGSCTTSVPPVSIFDDSGSKYVVLPPMQYGSCSARHYGEITAVLPNLPPQKNPLSSGPGVIEPDTRGAGWELLNHCPQQALVYVGLADPSPGNATDPAAWTPTLNASFAFAGPDARQKAAGQTWGACVLVANPGVDNNAAVGFAAPLRNAGASGRLPDLFGSCSASLSVTSAPEPCDDWHTYQILGQANLTTDRSSPAAQLQACRTLALRTTRMPDPTAGGRLQLEVFLDWLSADGAEVPAARPSAEGDTAYGTCGVHASGSAKLHGSLLGLGNGPVPLG